MGERDASLGFTELLGLTKRPTAKDSVRDEPIAKLRLSLLLKARLQRFMGWLLILPFCGIIALLMRVVGRYQIEDLAHWRKTYRELMREKTPTLICSNHLTFIDSALLIWALGSNHWYFWNYQNFSWNLPAGDFFKKKLIYRLVAYLSKCIFIHRDGSKDHKNEILELCRQLLRRGEVVTIFPEGKRSRSGRFETSQLTYGMSKIVASLENCRVLCFYIRSDKQKGYSNYPPKGSRFHIKLDVLRPHTNRQGKEAYAEITDHIAQSIKKMEETYFLERP